MNGVVTVRLLGGLGNQVMQYLHARAYAEQIGAEFQCDRWVGSKIWHLEDKPIDKENRDLPRRTEHELIRPDTNICISTYAQSQQAMIYTKSWAMSVFPWERLRYRLSLCKDAGRINDLIANKSWSRCVAHVRRGDFVGDYPTISRASYVAATVYHKRPPIEEWVTDEEPTIDASIPAEISFLPDFYRLLTSLWLFRANSSFSWVAALLGHAEVFSPEILHLDAGEHDVSFVAGNHSALSNRTGKSNLYVNP